LSTYLTYGSVGESPTDGRYVNRGTVCINDAHGGRKFVTKNPVRVKEAHKLLYRLN
jgi:hypothetical protein